MQVIHLEIINIVNVSANHRFSQTELMKGEKCSFISLERNDLRVKVSIII